MHAGLALLPPRLPEALLVGPGFHGTSAYSASAVIARTSAAGTFNSAFDSRWGVPPGKFKVAIEDYGSLLDEVRQTRLFATFLALREEAFRLRVFL